MPNFEEERRGYSKEQVDEYIATIQSEYQTLQQELLEAQKQEERNTERLRGLKEQLGETRDALKQLDQEKKELNEELEHLRLAGNPAYSDAIASALVSAEMSAKQIIANAKKEAELTSQSAMRELSDIIRAKKTALEQVHTLADKLTILLAEEAELKEAGEASAQKIINRKEMEKEHGQHTI